MDLDPTWLFLSLIPGGVGFVLMVYGKKQGRWPQAVAGALLLIYPYFTSSVTSLVSVGAAIGFGTRLRRAGEPFVSRPQESEDRLESQARRRPACDPERVPELPEVESVRRELAPVMVGARIDAVELRRAGLRAPFPRGFATRLAGQTVEALTRRAKYLLAGLSSGDTLLMHLGMSGSFRVNGAPGRDAGRPAAPAATRTITWSSTSRRAPTSSSTIRGASA